MAHDSDDSSTIAGPAEPDPRIVLGLDYGTTYTGLAWLHTTGQDSPSVKDIKVFRSWPTKDAKKVPSAYSYSPSANGCKQWGYSIDDESLVIRWTKLELEHRTTSKELDDLRKLISGLNLINELRGDKNAGVTNNVPLHLSKNAGDIVGDYLGKVAKEWYRYMKKGGKNILSNVPLDIVITHPANWSYEAMNATFRAVNRAFHKGMFPKVRNIYFTSEPEACALYTLQDLVLKDDSLTIEGECFVLCDAGGGTVDLVSYRIESLDPFRLTRVGGMSGGRYGATFIDRAFLEWIQSKLPDLDILLTDDGAAGHFVLVKVGRILLERFQAAKHAFAGTGPCYIEVPEPDTANTHQQEGFENGVITLSETDVKAMFNESVRGTVDLISRQVVQVQSLSNDETPCEVANIFLSGGFSESPYLFNEVNKFAMMRDIHVERTDDCWNGVVKGAVLRGMGIGIEPPMKAKSCPSHYGIIATQGFAKWRHDRVLMTVDAYHGKKVVPDQVAWLIRKGDVLLPDQAGVSHISVKYRFTDEDLVYQKRMKITIAVTAMNSPPSSLAALPKDQTELFPIDIDFSSVPKEKFKRVAFQANAGFYYEAVLDIEYGVAQEVAVKFTSCGEAVGSWKGALTSLDDAMESMSMRG